MPSDLPPVTRSSPVAVIIATVGRAAALRVCLDSLVAQTARPAEVMVVHSGSDSDTKVVCDEDWLKRGLPIRYFAYPQRSTALQRDFAVHRTSCPFILFADDDMEFSPGWIESLLATLESDPGAAAAMGCITNQQLPIPTFLWRLYRRLVASRDRRSLPGAVIGAGVANGFPVDAKTPLPAEWIGGCNTLMRRAVYLSVNGFAPYFRGSSPGEDIDLGFRISRRWRIYYVPAARCEHHQASRGRDGVAEYQYAYMRSRYAFCRISAGMSPVSAFGHIVLWAVFQTVSELAQLRRGAVRPGFFGAGYGRLLGVWSCVGWRPQDERFPDWHVALIRG